MSSTGLSSLAGKMRNLGQTSVAPIVDVALDGPSHVIRTFSTLDKISGSTSITAPVDCRFDRVEVALVGYVRAFVDKATTISAANGRNEAFQQFLCVLHPLEDQLRDRNVPKQLQQDVPLTIPFSFVVPEQLLPRSCNHRCNSQKLKQCHLALPPTLGDAEQSGYGSSLLDDLAPSMATISYGVRVRVFRNRQRDGKEYILSAHTHKIRIVPGQEEQPPVTVYDRDEDYCTRRERGVRKGLLKGKTGRIVMEAAQPTSFRLPPPSNTISPPEVSTKVTINLRYDPIDAAAQPPRLQTLNCKMKPITYYASAPRNEFPVKSTALYDSSQGLVFDTIPLAQRCMASVGWQKHGVDSRRRDSVMSFSGMNDGNIPAPTTASDPALPYYTAQLIVPLDLPKNKVFVPTFHSCLVSRVYILDLALSIANVGGGCTLKMPVQISCDSGNSAEMTRRVSEASRRVSSDLEDEILGIGRNPSPGLGSSDEEDIEAPPQYTSILPDCHQQARAARAPGAPGAERLPFGFAASLALSSS